MSHLLYSSFNNPIIALLKSPESIQMALGKRTVFVADVPVSGLLGLLSLLFPLTQLEHCIV